MEKELLFMCTKYDLASQPGSVSVEVYGITQEREKANLFFYLSGCNLVVIDRNDNLNFISNQYVIINKDAVSRV